MYLNNKSKKIAITGLCVAVLCILSMLSISFGGIPYSLSMLGIFLIGGFLTPGYATIACVCYLLLGIVGVPVFSGFTGGVGVLLGPTGGFLFAYPFMALLVAWIRKWMYKRQRKALIIGMLLALLLGYILGTGWFMLVTHSTFLTAVTICILPFFWFDVIKIWIAIAILLRFRTQSLFFA